MEEVLRNAADIARRDAVSKALQELHGSIVSLGKKLESVSPKLELDTMVQENATSDGASLKRGNAEECLDSLKLIYSDFLRMEDTIMKGLDERARAGVQVSHSDPSGLDLTSDRLTHKLSLASGLSATNQELQERLEGFYDNIKGFEQKLIKHQVDHENEERVDRIGSSPTSAYSGLSALQSAFGDQSVRRDTDKEKMGEFMATLDKLKGKLDNGTLLQSGDLSEYSIQPDTHIRVGEQEDGDFQKDPNELYSPTKSVQSVLSDMSVQAFNDSDKLGMGQVIGRMYDKMHDIVDLMALEKPSSLRSVSVSLFQSAAVDTPVDANGQSKPEDLANKLDFKKPQGSRASMKRGLSIEVDDMDELQKKPGDRAYPQSTKHGKQPLFDKKLSERDYTSNDPRRKKSDDLESIDGNIAERDDENGSPERKLKGQERRLVLK